MINFKMLLASLLVAGASAQATFAQVASEKKKSGYPYAFVGVQGGGQVTFGNYDATKLITPIGAVNIGGMFTPVVGARLHVSGINEKGGLKSLDKTYKYKFVTSNLDLMFNLCNAFAPNKHHVVNAYLLGGVGLGYAWDNDDLNKLAGNNITSVTNDNVNLRWSDDRLVHNFRVGAMLDFELSRLVGINLEVTANNYHDRFNSKLNGKGDWQVQALAGINFKFGRKRITEDNANMVSQQDYNQMQQAQQTPAPESKPEPKPEPKPAARVLHETKAEVFFTIGSSAVTGTEEAKLRAFAQWMKDYPSAKATLTGYADAGTGNAEINRAISEKRTEHVKKMLIEKYGIDASRLSTDFKGDKVQPFKDNDSNRVVIGVAKEQ